MAVGFSLTKITIIESLEPHEPRTGRLIADYVRSLLDDKQISMPVQVLTCEHRIEFFDQMKSLVEQALQTGEIPFLHIECHGDAVAGLELENGSCVSWPELSSLLTELNVATNFNLFAAVSACSGGYFLGEIRPGHAAPCWGMLAPTKTVDPAEIMRGFRKFYSAFVETFDAGKATSVMSAEKLSEGRWFGQTAEDWFERIVIGYVTNHCTKAEIRKRAKVLYRQLLDEDKRKSIGFLTRTIRQRNRVDLVDSYFEEFFQTTVIPNNTTRFASVRRRVAAKVERLRSTGNYVL